MYKLTYFYALSSPKSNSLYTGAVDMDSTTEWLDSKAYRELREKLQESAEKASNNLIKASDWEVTAFNKI